MPARDRTTLKGYFNAGDVPTESQFADLIDSFMLIAEQIGDMLKSVYDPDNDGVVEHADIATNANYATNADTLDDLHASSFAPAVKGVTNGDSHDHNGGDGANIPTNGLANDAVTNTKLANMDQNTVKGRITAGTGDPEDLNQTQVRTLIGTGSGNGLDADTVDNAHYSEWQSFTPSWTSQSNPQPSLGDGTLVGRYRKIGKSVLIWIELSAGSTTTFGTGQWRFSVPVTGANYAFMGTGLAYDYSGNAIYVLSSQYMLTANNFVVAFPNQGTANGGVKSDAPFAWASSDSFRLQLEYEAQN